MYLNAVGDEFEENMSNIIAKSYELMVEIKPDAVLLLGDTNFCLSVIGAKCLHIPIFHMKVRNRCKDGRNQLPYCRHHFGCEPGMLRTYQNMPGILWTAKVAYLCNWFEDSRGIA